MTPARRKTREEPAPEAEPTSEKSTPVGKPASEEATPEGWEELAGAWPLSTLERYGSHRALARFSRGEPAGRGRRS